MESTERLVRTWMVSEGDVEVQQTVSGTPQTQDVDMADD